jgi:hypothetical protein
VRTYCVGGGLIGVFITKELVTKGSFVMPILLYITMWSCVLAMTSALTPSFAPLESKPSSRTED